jgi:DNA-binding response OmpR family regulator
VAETHSTNDADASPRVLLVEDDDLVRQSILWTLEDEGTGQPDLVLLDIGLPGIDGFGVADRLRVLYGSQVPVVVLTADGRAAEKARRVGAVAYLHKPFEIDDLIRTVRTLLRRVP